MHRFLVVEYFNSSFFLQLGNELLILFQMKKCKTKIVVCCSKNLNQMEKIVNEVSQNIVCVSLPEFDTGQHFIILLQRSKFFKRYIGVTIKNALLSSPKIGVILPKYDMI
jgi:hypothetical protein